MANPKLTKRLNHRQTANHRASIQVSQLVNRLTKNAMGTLKTPQGEDLELTSGQIKSIDILLAKALPSLQSTTIEDITEQPQTKAEVEKAYQDAIRQLVQSLTPEELKAYRESRE